MDVGPTMLFTNEESSCGQQLGKKVRKPIGKWETSGVSMEQKATVPERRCLFLPAVFALKS